MKLVFDIETVGFQFDNLTESQQEFILRYADKEPDKALQLRMVTVSERRTDHDIVLACALVQQSFEYRHQGHEGCDAVSSGECAQRITQLTGKLDRMV